MAAPSAAAAPVIQLPPRQEGVSSGAWDAADVSAVREALADTEQPVAGPSGRGSEGKQAIIACS